MYGILLEVKDKRARRIRTRVNHEGRMGMGTRVHRPKRGKGSFIRSKRNRRSYDN